MRLFKFVDMKKIILFSFITFFISCGKEDSNFSWSFSKKFTTDKTIENVTINDKKFIVETSDGEKSECYINFTNTSDSISIDDKSLRQSIKNADKHIKFYLILPSSYKPLEYNINQWNGSEVNVKVSYQSKNNENKVVLGSMNCNGCL